MAFTTHFYSDVSRRSSLGITTNHLQTSLLPIQEAEFPINPLILRSGFINVTDSEKHDDQQCHPLN